MDHVLNVLSRQDNILVPTLYICKVVLGTFGISLFVSPDAC
jgi:hypothetical protein